MVELAVPSPHDHCHDVGVGVEVSVTEIGLGIRRKFLFVVKDAMGAASTNGIVSKKIIRTIIHFFMRVSSHT